MASLLCVVRGAAYLVRYPAEYGLPGPAVQGPGGMFVVHIATGTWLQDEAELLRSAQRRWAQRHILANVHRRLAIHRNLLPRLRPLPLQHRQVGRQLRAEPQPQKRLLLRRRREEQFCLNVERPPLLPQLASPVLPSALTVPGMLRTVVPPSVRWWRAAAIDIIGYGKPGNAPLKALVGVVDRVLLALLSAAVTSHLSQLPALAKLLWRQWRYNKRRHELDRAALKRALTTLLKLTEQLLKRKTQDGWQRARQRGATVAVLVGGAVPIASYAFGLEPSSVDLPVAHDASVYVVPAASRPDVLARASRLYAEARLVAGYLHLVQLKAAVLSTRDLVLLLGVPDLGLGAWQLQPLEPLLRAGGGACDTVHETASILNGSFPYPLDLNVVASRLRALQSLPCLVHRARSPATCRQLMFGSGALPQLLPQPQHGFVGNTATNMAYHDQYDWSRFLIVRVALSRQPEDSEQERLGIINPEEAVAGAHEGGLRTTTTAPVATTAPTAQPEQEQRQVTPVPADPTLTTPPSGATISPAQAVPTGARRWTAVHRTPLPVAAAAPASTLQMLELPEAQHVNGLFEPEPDAADVPGPSVTPAPLTAAENPPAVARRELPLSNGPAPELPSLHGQQLNRRSPPAAPAGGRPLSVDTVGPARPAASPVGADAPSTTQPAPAPTPLGGRHAPVAAPAGSEPATNGIGRLRFKDATPSRDQVRQQDQAPVEPPRSAGRGEPATAADAKAAAAVPVRVHVHPLDARRRMQALTDPSPSCANCAAVLDGYDLQAEVYERRRVNLCKALGLDEDALWYDIIAAARTTTEDMRRSTLQMKEIGAWLRTLQRDIHNVDAASERGSGGAGVVEGAQTGRQGGQPMATEAAGSAQQAGSSTGATDRRTAPTRNARAAPPAASQPPSVAVNRIGRHSNQVLSALPVAASGLRGTAEATALQELQAHSSPAVAAAARGQCLAPPLQWGSPISQIFNRAPGSSRSTVAPLSAVSACDQEQRATSAPASGSGAAGQLVSPARTLLTSPPAPPGCLTLVCDGVSTTAMTEQQQQQQETATGTAKADSRLHQIRASLDDAPSAPLAAVQEPNCTAGVAHALSSQQPSRREIRAEVSVARMQVAQPGGRSDLQQKPAMSAPLPPRKPGTQPTSSHGSAPLAERPPRPASSSSPSTATSKPLWYNSTRVVVSKQ